METEKSLFELIRNRLPDKYGLGDDGTEYDEAGVPNHSVFQQSLREDHEGDVGIFETYTQEQRTYSGYDTYIAEVQIAVVTKDGDIDSAYKYLKEALENIREDGQSTNVWIKICKLVNIRPLGKNSNGLQMVGMNISIKYLIDDED